MNTTVDITVSAIVNVKRLFLAKAKCLTTPPKILLLSILVTLSGSAPCMADYSKHPEAQSFIDEMVQKNGFNRKELQR